MSIPEYIVHIAKLNSDYKSLINVIKRACPINSVAIDFYPDLKSDIETITIPVADIVCRWTRTTDLRQILRLRNKRFRTMNILGKSLFKFPFIDCCPILLTTPCTMITMPLIWPNRTSGVIPPHCGDHVLLILTLFAVLSQRRNTSFDASTWIRRVRRLPRNRAANVKKAKRKYFRYRIDPSVGSWPNPGVLFGGRRKLN